ncbi:MAG TPA: FHA domain-containing protein [Candidatus Sulfotelmatobacter sp.]|nr:FHA domain-containing protein [Candidatus Sulfotelmatobacter sp.]
MVQFRILSGTKAGTSWVARRFPVRIGRTPATDFQLEDDGVWDQHLQLDFRPREGFLLTAQPQALARVNGQPVEQRLLRNGDTIEIGSARLQFWLSDTRQGSLRLREWITWFAIAAISLAQVALIYWLLT